MEKVKIVPPESERTAPLTGVTLPILITGFKKGDLVHYFGLPCTVLNVTPHSLTLRPAATTVTIKDVPFRFSKMIASGDLVLTPLKGEMHTRTQPAVPVHGKRCICGAVITPSLGVCASFKPSRRTRLKCAYCGHAESCHPSPSPDPAGPQP